jgi:hypothetical protein
MPRVLKQKSRSDIYRTGASIKSEKTKSGFRKDRSKPADETDTILIPKGTEYYQWSFNFGPTIRQLTPPRRSQLTMSPFLSQWYELQDSVSEWYSGNISELSDNVETLIEEIRALGEEEQEKLDNMPEQLQESNSGEILRERADGLEEIASELEAIGFETEVVEEDYEDIVDDDGEIEESAEDQHEEATSVELDAKLEEVTSAVENCNF